MHNLYLVYHIADVSSLKFQSMLCELHDSEESFQELRDTVGNWLQTLERRGGLHAGARAETSSTGSRTAKTTACQTPAQTVVKSGCFTTNCTVQNCADVRSAEVQEAATSSELNSCGTRKYVTRKEQAVNSGLVAVCSAGTSADSTSSDCDDGSGQR